MFKRRLKQWGADKNNKEDEMKAIVRKIKERLDQGKQSEIRVRGRVIDYGEAIRYWRRKGESIDDVIAHRMASATPEAVEITTPLPSRVATPTSLAVPERIFAMIRDYFEGSFASEKWIYDDPEFACHTGKARGNLGEKYLVTFHNHSITACHLFSNHLYREAGMTLSSMTSRFKEILVAEDPQTLDTILLVVKTFRDDGKDQIGTEILRQFCALGEIVVGKKHPLRLICGWLASADAFQFDEIIARCYQSVMDLYEASIGPMHYSSLTSRTYHINEFTSASGEKEKLLLDLLRQCEHHLGLFDMRTQHLRYSLATYYSVHWQYAEALRVGQDLVAYAQHRQPLSFGGFSFYIIGLANVAFSQYFLGQTLLAEESLREAIRLRVSRWGTYDGIARAWLVYLEKMLTEMGRWSSAAEVREEWMAMIDPADMI